MWINDIKQYKWVLPLLSLPLLVCAQTNPTFVLPYDLDQPSRQLELDKVLDEISGLSMTNRKDELVAIQDELGSLFYLDKQTGEIKNEVSFWKDGDYEGIELVGNDIYVVKNTGTLYQIKNAGKKRQKVIKYNGFLDDDYNIEGLTYWPQQNKLLLACKAEGKAKAGDLQSKCIYAFDIKSKSFEDEPFLKVERPVIEDYLSSCIQGADHQKICSIFNVSEEEFKLRPAAIAIHPISEQVYVLSAKGNLLLVMDMSGQILHISKLPKKLHRQPEGISFDSKGELYISNEKRKDNDANIVVYAYEG